MEVKVHCHDGTVSTTADTIEGMALLVDFINDMNTSEVSVSQSYVSYSVMQACVSYAELARQGRPPELIPPSLVRALAPWEEQFFTEYPLYGEGSVFTLLRAAEYLGYDPLVEAVLVYVAHRTAGATKEEVTRMFNL